jgi:hypothetical protein
MPSGGVHPIASDPKLTLLSAAYADALARLEPNNRLA